MATAHIWIETKLWSQSPKRQIQASNNYNEELKKKKMKHVLLLHWSWQV